MRLPLTICFTLLAAASLLAAGAEAPVKLAIVFEAAGAAVAADLLTTGDAKQSQGQAMPPPPALRIFGGDNHKFAVALHTVGAGGVAEELRVRLYQASSSLAVPFSEQPWKGLEVLPGQTLLENTRVEVPAVLAATSFLIQWVAGSNRVLGQTEVLVYPTNLLAELKPLLAENELGVLDPNLELLPSLAQNRIEYFNLDHLALEDFGGKLAILGPFRSQSQMRPGLAQAIQRIARKGVAVVWLQPPPGPNEEMKPSFYLVPEDKGAVVVVQPELVADFAENPQSQLNLIHFCKLALNPKPPMLPGLLPPP